MSKNLEQAIGQAGSAVNLLWEAQTPPSVVPRLAPEFSNWRDEQLAWRTTAVIYDQSHHMVDLNLKGPDALRLITDLAINSMKNFPVDKAKQFPATTAPRCVPAHQSCTVTSSRVPARWKYWPRPWVQNHPSSNSST